MTENVLLELAKVLGVPGLVLGLVWRLMEREHDERVKLQEQHNAALAKQTDAYADMVKGQTLAMSDAATAMRDVATSVREFIVQDRAEHKEIATQMTVEHNATREAIHHEARLKELA